VQTENHDQKSTPKQKTLKKKNRREKTEKPALFLMGDKPAAATTRGSDLQAASKKKGV